jgi:hypothetical protein
MRVYLLPTIIPVLKAHVKVFEARSPCKVLQMRPRWLQLRHSHYQRRPCPRPASRSENEPERGEPEALPNPHLRELFC